MRTAKYNLRLRVYRDTGETEVVTTLWNVGIDYATRRAAEYRQAVAQSGRSIDVWVAAA